MPEKLIPFNLEKWLANKSQPVRTADGREVTQLTFFQTARQMGPDSLAGVVNGVLRTYVADGSYFVNGAQAEYDLRLVSKTRTVWISVWLGGDGGLGATVYDTKSQAGTVANRLALIE